MGKPIIILPGCPENRSDVYEQTVGRASNAITYPGVIQCITLTGYGPSVLLGAHISPLADPYQKEQVFKQLNTWSMLNIKAWYVVGNMTVFFNPSLTGVDSNRWMSQADILLDLVGHFGKVPEFYISDTSEIAARYSWGIDIRVTRGLTEPIFTCAGATGMKVPYQIDIHRVFM